MWVRHLIGNAFAGKPIINAPANVSGAGVCPVGPPALGAGFFRVRAADGINKACSLTIIETFTLFISEAVLADVLLRVCEVNFVMGNVKVTAKDNRFCFVEFLNVL